MIGPQAYENLFLVSYLALTDEHQGMRIYVVEHEGRHYIYSYDWEILSMFESMAGFRQWCIEDVEENGGMYADRIEVIE